tara:strand:+ start:136 stop:453 length:318 start_codon:yes stop_codon:yes gene_type:complete
MLEDRMPNDVHWHLGTTCCLGAGDNCIHEQQLDEDLEIDDELDSQSKSARRIYKGLMTVKEYPCDGISDPQEIKDHLNKTYFSEPIREVPIPDVFIEAFKEEDND